jgi:8-amino-7-oxononanoate synthase
MTFQLNLQKRVFCSVHTFGKAPGVHGAVVLGSHILKDYLLNYAKSIIYTTALSTHSFVSIKCSYDLLKSDIMDKERSTLMTLVEYFRSLVKRVPSIHLLPSNSPIHGVLLPGNDRVVAVARYMRDRGFHVLPIRGPTVPEGKERLRITIHSYNTMTEIETLVQHLESASMMFSSKM